MIKKFLQFVFIFLIIIGWTFSGWPQVGNFSKINQAQASTFVQVQQYDNSSSSSATVNKPTGTADNDIMFAVVMRRTSTAPNTVPTGWALLGSHVNGIYQQRLYWKLAASEGSNYTWGWSSNDKTAITIATYRGGFDTLDPIDVVSNTEFVTTPNTTVRAASMNVTSSNSSLFWFGTIYSTTVRTWTKPSIPTTDWVEDYDGGKTSSDFSRTIDSMVWAGSGATGDMDGTVQTGGTTVKHAFAVALKPTPPPTPTITSYTNTTETALNYAGACTGCGARIGGGAGFRQSITITGTNFGSDPGAGNRSTATNNIKVGTHQIANSNVTSWSNTSITFLTDSAISGDTDTDWGINFGGASALTVTAGSQTTSGLNFYVFPHITSITQPAGLPADSAREYNASDTDGIITLNGTRLGTAVTGGYVRILGCDVSTCSSPSGTVTVNSWGNTAIEVQVPIIIANNVYTGSIAMQQGSGGNTKTDSYSTLRILPRIVSLIPSNGPVGTAVEILGDHFCQSGTCPGAFSAADKVTFTSGVVATTFTSWSYLQIFTTVPVGAVTGNVVVTSATSYTSNNKNFTVDAATTTLATGSDPSAMTIAPGAAATDVDQFTLQTDGGTEAVTSVTVNLSTNSGIGLLAITNSTNTVLGSTSSPITGSNVITVSGLTAGTSVTTFKVRVTPLSHVAMPAVPGASYSITAPVTAWAGSNTHAGSDTNPNALTIDNLSPAGVTSTSGVAGDAQIMLSWTNPVDTDYYSAVVLRRPTSAVADVPVEGVTYTVGNTIGTATIACVVLSPTATCTNTGLTNGMAYHYKIFTKDTSGNYNIGVVPTGSPFTPTALTSATPAKTTKAYINGATGTVSSATTYYFTANVPEQFPDVKNAYVEVLGVVSGGTGTITVKTNNVASRTYDVSATNPTFYRFLYQVSLPNTETNLNLNDVAPCSNSVVPGTGPLCNKVVLTPGTVSINVLSAKIITTYSYTP